MALSPKETKQKDNTPTTKWGQPDIALEEPIKGNSEKETPIQKAKSQDFSFSKTKTPQPDLKVNPTPNSFNIQLQPEVVTPKMSPFFSKNNPSIRETNEVGVDSEFEQEPFEHHPKELSIPRDDGNKLQAKLNEEDESLGMKPEEEMGSIQRSSFSSGGQSAPEVPSGLASKLQSDKGQSAPLSESVNQEMGQKMGGDFSNVRIHTDFDAIQMNEELGAKAFTHGNDIYFNSGQYTPENPSGKHLLAHELTHVVQQSGIRPVVPGAQVIQCQQPPQTAPPPITQQLYDQAIASMTTRASVNPSLLAILRQGRINNTIPGVYSVNSTLQIPIPAAPDAGSATSVPAVRISFNLEISSDQTLLPSGAFALFVNDPSTQTVFVRDPSTRSNSITRLLRIVTKASTGINAADTLGEALVHEGTHMLLEIDKLLSFLDDPGLSAAMTGTQTTFSRYTQAAASSSLRSALIASLIAEVNRVFTPTGTTAPTISASDASDAVNNVITRMLEERFAIDQELAAYPRTVSNGIIVNSYLWSLLAEETLRSTWPQGSNAQSLVTATTSFLDDVTARLNPPPPPPPVPTAPAPNIRPSTRDSGTR